MATMQDADFTHLFNLDGIELNFYDVEGNPKTLDMAAASGAPLQEPLQAQGLPILPHYQSIQQNGAGPNIEMSQGGGMFDFSLPMDMNFMPPATAMPTHSAMPATPNSVEMHNDTIRYMQHMHTQRMIMEQYQMKHNDTTSFTPQPSPAVGYESQPGYTVPGAYFSPLTSPALEGQHYTYQTNTSASSAATASPIDPDIDMPDANNPNLAHATRSRRRPGPTRSANSTSKTRTSPITKPQTRRKANLSASISERDVQAVRDQTARSERWTESPALIASLQVSTDSVSPEPLSDLSMGPPKTPASATHSPAIKAKKSKRPAPATPTSLLRIPSDSRSPVVSPNLQSPSLLTPLALPEAATAVSAADTEGPPVKARKTPKLGPLSTPSGSATPRASVTSSTPTTAVNSPLSATFPMKKGEGKLKNGKKRNSMSAANLVSPALRPRISPSLKPMMPDGAQANDDNHTMYLASRSNYQLLIEGTQVPGVNYPQELSTNLTSKRTSHKLAEQGRRNRINTALQEMMRLLPHGSMARSSNDSQSPGEEDEPFKKGGDAKANGNSKAATVESAIEYIKTLRQERDEMSRLAEQKDKDIEQMKKKLQEMEKLAGQKSSPLPDVEEETNEPESGS